jgi:colanic acid/amylovoran biosynthesis glycosyltransferase
MDIKNPHLAIVIPERNVVSESFIGSHIDGLFEDPSVVWGSPRPLFTGEGDGVLSGVTGALARLLALGWRMDAKQAQGAVGRRLPAGLYTRSIARFLRRRRVDVVLAEYGPTAVEIMDACSKSKTPLVVHFHGYDAYQDSTLNRLREAYQGLFRKAFRIVVVSRHMRQHLIQLGAPANQIICNPCGADVERFRSADPQEAPPHFLALGRFVEKKGPALTLQAFSHVHTEEPQTQLVMLGDGPLRDECIELAQKLGVDRHVRFPGSVDHDEVVVWMRRARCFVQHSLQAADGDSEGTPVAVLEASACGLPVVSTKHGGIIDAVIDGAGGFLVDEGDVETMADHMLRLVRDPGLAATLGAAGRRHIVENYSAEKSLSRLRAVLLDAAQTGR